MHVLAARFFVWEVRQLRFRVTSLPIEALRARVVWPQRAWFLAVLVINKGLVFVPWS